MLIIYGALAFIHLAASNTIDESIDRPLENNHPIAATYALFFNFILSHCYVVAT